MNKSIATLLVLAAGTVLSGAVLPGHASAQQAAPATPPPGQPVQTVAQPAPPWSPKWSSPEIEKAAKLLMGSWKSEAVSQVGGAGAPKVEIEMNVSPIQSDLADTMYVEIARVDSAWRPYRQAIFQLYTYKGGLRLRTYEIASTPKISSVLTGLWLAPEMLPMVKRDDLIATIDVDLKPAGGGLSGKSPYPYPTGAGGAVEMTSELSITPDTLISVDRGYDAKGKIVWGSGESDKYTFKHFTPEAKLERLDNGLLRIDYRIPGGDATKIEPTDSVAAHYIGWLFSNGAVFDTSRDRTPYIFEQGRVMPGIWLGIEGLTNGSVVRLVVPPALGYGDKGAGRSIPPNATLAYEMEIMDVQKHAPEETSNAPAPAGGPPPGQPPHSGPATTPPVNPVTPPAQPK